MATSIKKEEPLTKTGPSAIYKKLQAVNDSYQLGGNPSNEEKLQQWEASLGSSTLWNPLETAEKEVMSPLRNKDLHLGGSDYWGNSIFDTKAPLNPNEFAALNDLRSENQPWFSKIANGIGKGAVTLATTAIEGWMLPVSAAMAISDGKLSTLWNNPITQGLQMLSELSEEYMPNYYTQDEQEQPLHHIFSANWIGDGLIKNLGFMIGAFYGGIPAAKLIGKTGEALVKGANAFDRARKVAKASNIAKGAIEEAEAIAKFKEGMDLTTRIGKYTRQSSKFIGAMSSAVNEGIIEAINNSKDWAASERTMAESKYNAVVQQILGDASMDDSNKDIALQAAQAKYHEELEKIEEGRAAMGNADLIMNIPVLLASNLFSLGKLYARGFESNRRQLGTLWNWWKLPGKLGNLSSGRTKKGAIMAALGRPGMEGLEEYLQRAASDAAGNTISNYIKREVYDDYEGPRDTLKDMIVSFGKSSMENLKSESAWNEFVIGALSGALGMPVFGSQTKNAWLGKGSPIGLAGGSVGSYQDYMDAKRKEEKLAKFINEAIKNPNFQKPFNFLQKYLNDDSEMLTALLWGDKKEYKDLDFDQLFEMINAAAATGHYGELRALVEHGGEEFSDDDLAEIVELTKEEKTKEELKQQDINLRNFAAQIIKDITKKEVKSVEDLDSINTDGLKPEDEVTLADAMETYRELSDKIDKGDYVDSIKGDFIREYDGVPYGMNVKDPEGMREILKKRRESVIKLMDSILSIRDKVDMDTDGMLDETQLKLLTKMRAKIDNIVDRELSMSDEVRDLLGVVLNDVKDGNLRSRATLKHRGEEVTKAKDAYDAAKAKREEIEKDKSKSEAEVIAAKAEEAKAKKRYEHTENDKAGFDLMVGLFERLLSPKKETFMEALGRNWEEKGMSKVEALLSAFEDWAAGTERSFNIEEMEAYLSTNYRFNSLATFINDSESLDREEKKQLMSCIYDLSLISQEKLKYREKFNEYMGNTKTLEEDIKNTAKQISKKKKENKIEELALSIKGATSLFELDDALAEVRKIDKNLSEAALKKAKETGSAELKDLINKYENLTSYYDEFIAAMMKYDSQVQADALPSLAKQWQDAIEASSGTLEEFKNGLLESVEVLKKGLGGIPASRTVAAAKAIEEIMEALDDGAASVSSREGVKDTPSESSASPSSKGTPPKGLRRRAVTDKIKAFLEKYYEEAKEKGGEIEDIDSIEKLKSLEGSADIIDSIENYNRTTSPRSKILDKTIKDLYDTAKEAIEKKQKKEEGDKGEEENKGDEDTPLEDIPLGDGDSSNSNDNNTMFPSTVAKNIRKNLLSGFTSDPVSLWGFGLDYKEEYNIDSLPDPIKGWYKAVREILQKTDAYGFVDRGFLGAVWRKLGKNLPVRFLRSTDETLLSMKERPATFLAIEATDDVVNTLKDEFFGNEIDTVNRALEHNVVKINGVNYFIIGCLSYSRPDNMSEEERVSFNALQEAFKNMQDYITESCREDIEKAQEMRAAGEIAPAFVLDTKYSTTINAIHTGRLELKKNADDRDKVSLLDFMNSEESATDVASEEWTSGAEVYFGIISDKALKHGFGENSDLVQNLNTEYLSNKNNQGAVFILVKKADGRYYPLRCTRRTLESFLEEFMKSLPRDDNGTFTLEQFNEAIKDKDYIKAIFNILNTAFDPKASEKDRKNACNNMYRFMPGGSYRLFLQDNGKLVIVNNEKTGSDRKVQEFNPSENAEDRLETILEFLDAWSKVGNSKSGKKVIMSLPFDYGSFGVSGRDVVLSGAFEIGIKGYHNFNANFTVMPKDENNNEIQIGVTKVKEHPGRVRGFERTWNVGYGVKTYLIEVTGTGGTYTVSDKNKKDAKLSQVEINRVLAISKAINASGSVEGAVGLDNIDVFKAITNEETKSKVRDAFSNLVIIPVVTNGEEELWAYYNGDLFMYTQTRGRVTEKKGQTLMEKIADEIANLEKASDEKTSKKKIKRRTSSVKGEKLETKDDDVNNGGDDNGGSNEPQGPTSPEGAPETAQNPYEDKIAGELPGGSEDPYISVLFQYQGSAPDKVNNVLGLLKGVFETGQLPTAEDAIETLTDLIEGYVDNRGVSLDDLSSQMECKAP